MRTHTTMNPDTNMSVSHFFSFSWCLYPCLSFSLSYPSSDQERNLGEVEKYNDIIAHETLRVAVCDAMENNKCPAIL